MPTANLFLVGAPKAGTTSLAAWLSDHPQIYWSLPKEPFYWAEDFPGMRAHYGYADREAYDELFASPQAQAAVWRADGSTTYLYSASAVGAILAESPDARFIVCLRRHDELVPSYHRTQVTALNETETDLEKAWWRAVHGRPVPGSPLDPKLVDYPLIGAIGEATARLVAQVPAEQLAVVLFEDIRDSPQETYRSLLAFLGVDETHELDLVARNASDKAARFAMLRRLTHRPPAWLAPTMARVRQWSRSTSMPGVQRLKRAGWRPADRPEVSPEFQAELRDFFAADLEVLEAALDRRLDAWRTGAAPGPASVAD